MKFQKLRSLARAYVPQATTQALSNDNRDTILNEGALDIAFRMACLPADKKINVVAEQAGYSLSGQLDRFLLIDKPGVWWNDGSQWEQLRPVTIKWLDEHRPNWRDEDSGDPLYFFKRGDTLQLHPKPDTSLSSGLWIYYAQKPLGMVNDNDFPFYVGDDQEDERDELSPLSELILLYFEIKALKILGKKQESVQKIEEYKFEIAEKENMINRNFAVAHGRNTKLMGRRIP